MAQKTVTTPLQSTNKTPYQAPLPTALRGRQVAPVISTTGAYAFRRINGITGADTAPSLIELSSLPSGGSDYITGGVTHLKGFATKLAAMQRIWTLYAQCADTYTDTGHPTNNYSGVSSIVGAGQCPQASGYPSGQPFFPYPPPYGGGGGGSPSQFNIVSATDWNIPDTFNNLNLDRITSGSISPSSIYSGVKADVLAGTLGTQWGYDDAIITGLGMDCSALNPASFTGGIIGAVASSISLPGAAVTCGWQISPQGPVVSPLLVQREKATLSAGRYYYWIGEWKSGLSPGSFNSADLGTDIVEQINFLSDGYISGGQSIGLSVDSPTITLPFPTDPFPITAMGTNGIFRYRIFAVIGKSTKPFTAGFGLHMGNNF